MKPFVEEPTLRSQTVIVAETGAHTERIVKHLTKASVFTLAMATEAKRKVNCGLPTFQHIQKKRSNVWSICSKRLRS
jgi:hypothetical protein